MATHYDVIVVGAGIFGSCAAYHSQKLGKKTLLLEQFPLGHTNGSSHGKSRITRYAHTNATYLPLVHDAYQQIEQLEDKRSEKLWRKTSLLWVTSSAVVNGMASILKEFSVDHSVIKGSEIVNRYPQFNFKDSDSALIDPMGGVILADKWINAFQEEFKSLGGTIQGNTEMLNYKDDGEKVTAHSSKGDFTADKLIITVGTWIGKILPQLPLEIKPDSLHVLYWKTKDPKDTHFTEMGSFPVFIGKQEGHETVFGVPSIDYPNSIKFMAWDGQPIDHGAPHPDVHDKKLTEIPQRYLREFMPLFNADEPTHTEKCKYTNSEDHHYVIDFVPGSKNVLVGACDSGSGFKVAPTIGKVLAEMSQGLKTSVDVSFFSLKRFAKKTQANI